MVLLLHKSLVITVTLLIKIKRGDFRSVQMTPMESTTGLSGDQSTITWLGQIVDRKS